MRLFVSLDLPGEIYHFLRDVQALLPEGKKVLADHFHLTLMFLGEVEDEKIDDVKERLTNVSANEFDLRMNGLGMFKNKLGVPRVIWIKTEEHPTLFGLQTEVSERLIELGFESGKEFVPHITLARVKEVDGSAFEEELGTILFKERAFPVKSFSLMESQLTEEGARYRVVDSYELSNIL